MRSRDLAIAVGIGALASADLGSVYGSAEIDTRGSDPFRDIQREPIPTHRRSRQPTTSGRSITKRQTKRRERAMAAKKAKALARRKAKR